MNANELADELANVGWDKPFSNWELLDQAATMLRQLQAKNDALKAILKEAVNGMGHSHQAKFKEYLK